MAQHTAKLKVVSVPAPAPVTEEEIDLRIRCAVQYTDITALSQCMVTFLYCLQTSLEEEGKYRHEAKLAVTRASNRAVYIVNEITDAMKAVNKMFVNSYVNLYDELMVALDSAILLQGSERYLSMIHTICKMIDAKLAILRHHNHTFTEMRCVESMTLVDNDLRPIQGERHDLEPIFRPLLAKMLTEEELQAAKRKYMKYYHIKPKNNGQ